MSVITAGCRGQSPEPCRPVEVIASINGEDDSSLVLGVGDSQLEIGTLQLALGAGKEGDDFSLPRIAIDASNSREL